MNWRRFSGSNGSYRAGLLNVVAGLGGRAGLAAAVLLAASGAGAAQFDRFVAAGAEERVVGDFPAGQQRSVVVSDGAGDSATPFVPGEEAMMPDSRPRYGFGPALINRCLGPACPRWVGQADVLMLWQGNVPGTSLLTLSTIEPFPTVLNGNQLPYSLGTGPRTAVIFNVDQCHGIEANYFNAGNFSGSREFVAPAEDQLAWAALGQLPNVGFIDSGTASTAGRIQSFELNWRRQNGRSITWIAGFRWIEWNDSFTMTDTYNDPNTDPSTGTDSIAASSVNNLYGGQLGLDAVLLTVSDIVRFNGVAKAGVYGNMHAASTMTVESSDPNRILPTAYTATGNSTGFFGEVGINGSVRLTDHLFWRAGYNFFWISGVATSLNQVKAFDMTVPSGTLNLGGSVFLQGVNTGIEAIW
ncbi:MAG: BBP7 family outer membrane beta-barrel protein [Planctomycetaceae bacterium]